MDNKKQNNMVTMSTHEPDGSLKIESIMKLQYGSSICVESVWKPTQGQPNLKMTDTSVRFDDLSFHLPRSPALMAHAELVSKERRTHLENQPLNDTSDRSLLKTPTTVHMVTRHDGVEVFLDSLSAAFWGGNRKLVKEVSVNTAAFVLKADGESVIESAVSATTQIWEQIDAILSIISLATQLKARIKDMDLSLEELTNRTSALTDVS